MTHDLCRDMSSYDGWSRLESFFSMTTSKIERIEDAGGLEVRLGTDPRFFLHCAPVELSNWWFSCGKQPSALCLETNS